MLTILRCTLLSHVASEQVERVSFGLNNFYHIRDWSIEAYQEAHLADLSWLNKEINPIFRLKPNRKVIVLTHYCPSTLSTLNMETASFPLGLWPIYQTTSSGNVKLSCFGLLDTHISTVTSEIQWLEKGWYQTKEATTSPSLQDSIVRRSLNFRINEGS